MVLTFESERTQPGPVAARTNESVRHSIALRRPARWSCGLLLLLPCLALAAESEPFLAGEHYQVLEAPVAVPNPEKIQVIMAFSYECRRCLGLEAAIRRWEAEQDPDVDLLRFHTASNPAMRFYARAYLTALQLGVIDEIHFPLADAILVKRRSLADKASLQSFFAEQGVASEDFESAFESPGVLKGVEQAEGLTRDYNLGSPPEFVVNGRYRVDPMRAGGRARMLEVVSFLVEKERLRLKATR